MVQPIFWEIKKFHGLLKIYRAFNLLETRNSKLKLGIPKIIYKLDSSIVRKLT